MKLYCMRHCDALPLKEDSQRGLSFQGRSDATKMADFLSSTHAVIGHVLHSSKLRTKQTAEIISLALPIEHITECDTLLSEDMDVMPLVDMVATWGSDTLLVGHMPFMPRLIVALSGAESQTVMEHFSTGTIACLEQSGSDDWQLVWIRSPNDLQRS